MSAQYVIICDVCKEEGPPSKRGIAAARALARREGWTHPERGRDRCALCTAAHAQRHPPDTQGYV